MGSTKLPVVSEGIGSSCAQAARFAEAYRPGFERHLAAITPALEARIGS